MEAGQIDNQPDGAADTSVQPGAQPQSGIAFDVGDWQGAPAADPEFGRPAVAFAEAGAGRLQRGLRFRRVNYDVVVIGGGHNGLTAAAYLARAGRSVPSRAPSDPRGA